MWGKHKNSSTQMLKTWKPIQNNKSNKKNDTFLLQNGG